MNRWQLYTLLQGKGDFNCLSEHEIMLEIENMNADEAREGIIEYLLALKRGGILHDG